MINKLDLKTVDIIKFNHWLNARKITSQFINKKQNSLSKKLNKFTIQDIQMIF